MDNRPPPVDGEYEQYRVGKDDQFLLKRPLKFADSVNNLQPFLTHFTFFTPAPAYLWGYFQDIILQDFQLQRGEVVEFYHARFKCPIFGGLETPDGDDAWNCVLWAIESRHWEAFANHVCGAVMNDEARKAVFRYAIQELTVADPLTIDKAGIITAVPTMPVAAIGVRSNCGCAAFIGSWGNKMIPPSLQFFPPDQECVLYADLLYKLDDPSQALLATDPISHVLPTDPFGTERKSDTTNE